VVFALKEIDMMSNTVKNVAAVIGLSLTSHSCMPPATSESDINNVTLPAVPWNDLGEGVYTFQHDQTWPASLVKFRKEYPDLEITSIYSDKEGGHGSTTSVVVVTEKKN